MKHELCDLQRYFPDFLWLLRDLTLKIPLDERKKPQTLTEYVKSKVLVRSDEVCLTPSDEVVKVVLHLFPSLECRMIPFPPGGDPLSTSPSITNDFNAQIEETIQYILSKIRPKPGFSINAKIDGLMLAKLAQEYVNAINSSESLVLEDSWHAAVTQKLHILADELVRKYQNEMEAILETKYPLEEGTLDKIYPLAKSTMEEEECTTLMDFHQQVFMRNYLILQEKADQLLPILDSASDDFTVSPAEKKKRDILVNFQNRIYMSDHEKLKGEVTQFVDTNRRMSQEKCDELFDQLFWCQDEVNLQQLKHKFFTKAVGPAKKDVFDMRTKWISGPPIQLEATTKEHNQIRIKWKEPTFHPTVAWKYQVQTKEESGDWVNNSDTSSNLFAIVTGLRPKRKYQFRVCGVNDHIRKGEWSEVLTVTTPSGKPSNPTKPEIKMNSSTIATIFIKRLKCEEESGSPVTHVIVESSLADVEHKPQEFTVKPSSDNDIIQEIALDNATTDGFYQFRVLMKNDAGISGPSDWARVATSKLIPGPPQNIETIENTNDHIKISWNVPNNHPVAAKHYEVEIKEQNSEAWTKLAEVEILTAMFHHPHPNTIYMFRVCACSNSEERIREWSEILVVKSAPGPPCQPPKPKVDILAPQRATIFVQKLKKEEENGSPVTHIIVEKSTEASDQWSPEEFEVDAGVQLTITLENSVQYFRVRMKNKVGVSDPSEYDPAPYLIPGPPQNIHEEENCWVEEMSHNRITISWDKPDAQPQAVKQYEVEVKQESDGQSISENVDSLEKLTVTFSKLRPNSIYKFRVRGTNKEKYGEWSETFQIKSAPGAPNYPSRPSIEVLSNQIATLTVPKFHKKDENGSPVDQLIVQVCTEEDPNAKWSDYKEFPMECDRVIRKDIPLNDDSFYFRVRVKNEVGKSEPSDPIEVPACNLVPGRPENLDATPSLYCVDIKWDKPERFSRAAKCYEVEIKKGSEWKHAAKSEKSKRIVHISDLKPNNEYCFRMVAINEERRGEHSDELTTKTLPGPPCNPHKPELHMTSVATAELTVQRLKPEEENGSSVTHVIVESSNEDDMENWNVVDTFRLTGGGVSDKFRIEVAYGICCFRVKMRNDIGDSDPSPVVSIPPAVFPGEPKNVRTHVSHDQVTISWQKPEINPTAATEYELKKQLHVGNKQWKNFVTVDGVQFEAVAENLRPKTSYKFLICAVNGPYKMKGAYLEVSATTIGFPGPPKEVKIIAKRYTCFKIGWDAPETNPEYVQHYVVHIRRNCDRDWLHLKLLPNDCSSVVISGLRESTCYQVCVQPLNQNGNGGSGYIIVETKGRWRWSFLNSEDGLTPDDPAVPSQRPVREPQLPKPFNKSDQKLNEERTSMSNVVRRF